MKQIKTEGGMNEATYKRLYPTGAGSPKFYGLPKVHKQGTPLRPTVSSIRDSNLPNIQGVVKNPQAPGGEIYTSYSQQPRLLGTPEGYQTSL